MKYAESGLLELHRHIGRALILLSLVFLSPAIALTDDELNSRMDDLIDLLVEQPETVWQELQTIREASEAASDPELWGDWHLLAAYAKLGIGDLDEAAAYANLSLDLYNRNESEIGILEAYLARGDIRVAHGKYPEAMQDFEIVMARAVELQGGDPADTPYFLAAAHQSLGDVYTVLGDFASAIEHIRDAYRLYSEMGDDAAKSASVGLLANLYVDLDQSEAALALYQEAAELDRKVGDELNVAINLYNIGRAYTSMGEHVKAHELYDRSMEIAERLDLIVTEGYIYFGRGLSYFDQGRDEQAHKALEEAANILEEVQDEYMLSRTRLQLARLASRAGDHPETIALLQALLPRFESADADKDLVDVHRLMAESHAALGDHRTAYQHSTRGNELMQTLASQERARRTASLRVQFDSERTEAEKAALSEENRLKAKLLDRERFFKRMSLIGVLVLVLIAIALTHSIWRQKQLESALTLLANTDDLTGLLNRRRLFELGNYEVHRALRYGHPLGVLVLDIDHFKSINDSYGHAVGDLVLRRIASHVAGGLREEDSLGRFGGEEFVALLPHTKPQKIIEVAERLREDVADLDLASCNVDQRLTLSIGVTWLQGRGDTFQLLVNRADAALYDAKAEGRNKVVVLGDSETDAA